MSAPCGTPVDRLRGGSVKFVSLFSVVAVMVVSWRVNGVVVVVSGVVVSVVK
jgi:hypothetical protein